MHMHVALPTADAGMHMAVSSVIISMRYRCEALPTRERGLRISKVCPSTTAESTYRGYCKCSDLQQLICLDG